MGRRNHANSEVSTPSDGSDDPCGLDDVDVHCEDGTGDEKGMALWQLLD